MAWGRSLFQMMPVMVTDGTGISGSGIFLIISCIFGEPQKRISNLVFSAVSIFSISNK
jgi:hypothetical protein